MSFPSLFRWNPFTSNLDLVGVPGGEDADSFVTDNGTAIPALRTLKIFGGQTSENNDLGIQTSATGNENEVDIVLTNRITGSVTTTDATPTTLITFNLGTAGVIIAQGDITAYNVTDTAGASYTYAGAARTNGTTGTEIGVEQKDIFEEVAMETADFTFSVSGNNAIIQVIGIAGKTIHWSTLFNYRKVS